MRSFGIVEDKLAEADFFVDKIEEAGRDLFSAQCYLSAFLSASRSVTFAIQASIGELPGFKSWYKQTQNQLAKDELAQHFLKFRNESVHIGLSHIRSGEQIDGNYKFFFQGLFDENTEGPKEDVLTASRKHLKNLVAIVYECFSTFGYDIDPDMYYTTQNARRLDKSIETFESELDFPEGWTYVEGFDMSTRLQLLREQLPVLEVDFLFEKYLGKNRLPILKREGIA